MKFLWQSLTKTRHLAVSLHMALKSVKLNAFWIVCESGLPQSGSCEKWFFCFVGHFFSFDYQFAVVLDSLFVT
jgi:hypothetical protein